MNTIILNKGFSISDVFIPPFELKKGEYLILKMNCDFDFKEDSLLVNSFIYENNIAIEKFEKLELVQEFIMPNNLLYTIFFNQSVKTYLVKKGVSSKDIYEITRDLSLSPNDKMSSLGMNLRKLLALRTCYYNSSNNIIINLAGLDYTGISNTYKLIKENIHNGCVIELSYNCSREIESYFGSKTIDVIKTK